MLVINDTNFICLIQIWDARMILSDSKKLNGMLKVFLLFFTFCACWKQNNVDGLFKKRISICLELSDI